MNNTTYTTAKELFEAVKIKEEVLCEEQVKANRELGLIRKEFDIVKNKFDTESKRLTEKYQKEHQAYKSFIQEHADLLNPEESNQFKCLMIARMCDTRIKALPEQKKQLETQLQQMEQQQASLISEKEKIEKQLPNYIEEETAKLEKEKNDRLQSLTS